MFRKYAVYNFKWEIRLKRSDTTIADGKFTRSVWESYYTKEDRDIGTLPARIYNKNGKTEAIHQAGMALHKKIIVPHRFGKWSLYSITPTWRTPIYQNGKITHYLYLTKTGIGNFDY